MSQNSSATCAGDKAMLEALVIGYEVACAAAAAHLLRLKREQIKHALGIAEYHAPNCPMMRDVDDPSIPSTRTSLNQVSPGGTVRRWSANSAGLPDTCWMARSWIACWS